MAELTAEALTRQLRAIDPVNEPVTTRDIADDAATLIDAQAAEIARLRSRIADLEADARIKTGASRNPRGDAKTGSAG